MKARRLLRASGVACALSGLFFVCSARSQNRPPGAVSSRTIRPSVDGRPTTQRSADEQALFDDANRERASQGLQPLQWDPMLAAAARQHARVMARENLLSHQCPGEPPLDQRAARAGARFAMIAENVAVGPSPERIHEGWMHSPGHRKNILNAEVTAVGMATTRGSKGLFAVQDFSRPVADLSLEQQEKNVVSLLTGTGLLAANATEDARKTCGMDRGFTGASVLYVIKFEVTDLSKLPEDLLRKVESRRYGKAAVGACRYGDTAGFTRYRIAVLLY